VDLLRTLDPQERLEPLDGQALRGLQVLQEQLDPQVEWALPALPVLPEPQEQLEFKVFLVTMGFLVQWDRLVELALRDRAVLPGHPVPLDHRGHRGHRGLKV
jgi:hypothetical protein